MRETPRPVREPAVAGQFYPAGQKALGETVDHLLSISGGGIAAFGDPIALIAPHAGYPYSGAIAAAAYRSVLGRPYDAVVVIGPSHRESFEGASVFCRGSYRTPLGLVRVDESLAGRILEESPEAVASDAGHRVSPKSPFGLGGIRGEHSIEVQLPFLQRVVPDFSLVPLVLSWLDFPLCRSLGRAIARASRGRRVLLVASSDLYHGESREECTRLDSETLRRICDLDPEGLSEGIRSRECQACGGGPILATIIAAREIGADSGTLVARGTSADVTGLEGGYIVGYGAVVFTGSGGEDGIEASHSVLSATERGELLRIAREAIHSALTGSLPPPSGALSPAPGMTRGVFVTLKSGTQLRGCIGQVHPSGTLAETVREVAVSSALRDPRFPPVALEELAALRLEVSVLGPLRRMESPRQIVVGVHGLLLQHPRGTGLLLPQVAVERGWDPETFLAQTCLKAGLPTSAWRKPETEVSTFSAEVFGEP